MPDLDTDDIETTEDFDPEAADGEWSDDAEVEEDDIVLDDDEDEDIDVVADVVDVVDSDDADDDDDDDDSEALDELEAEELEMLTDDEESETLIVDEAAELRAIRRAELALEGDGVGERAADEFLCLGCFLVLKRTQLVDADQSLCRDCAA